MKRNTWMVTFGVTGINVALFLFTSILVARTLGPEGRGLILALVFWPTLLFSIFYLSLNEATIIHVARARALGKSSGRDHPSGSALTLHLLAAVGITPVIFLILPFALGVERSQYSPLALLYAAVFIPLTTLDLCYNALRQGRGDVVTLNLLRLCQPLIYAAGMLILLLFRSVAVETVLAAILISIAVSILLGFFFEGARLPRWDLAAMGKILRTGFRIHTANLLLYVGAEADKLVVIRWMDDASAGLYAVALAVSLLGSGLVVQSLQVMAYPKITGTADPGQQVSLICKFTHAATVLLVLINGTTAIVVPWLLPLLFGLDFAAAVPVAMILLLMNTFRGIRQVMDRALRATLNVRRCVISESVGLGCFIILAPIGSIYGGLTGIAWAMAGAQAMALVAMVSGTAKLFDLSVLDLWGLRPSTVSQLLHVAVQEFWAARERWAR